MRAYEYVLVIGGTILWALPFPLAGFHGRSALRLDRRARWGVLLECVGYTLLWQGSFWTRATLAGRDALAAVLIATACVISWTAARALGRQLRVDAALGPQHELVRSGPYGLVRHPIYTSMLCLLLGTGVVVAPWYLFLGGAAVFLIGTEIRMRVEEALLAAQFGEQFEAYRHTVPRLIPFTASMRRRAP